MATLTLTLNVLFKQFFTDRRGNRNAEICTEDKADVANVYANLSSDYTKADAATQTAIKTRFLELAKAHADKLGTCKHLDEQSVRITERTVSVSFFRQPRTVLATGEVTLP